MKKIKKYKNPFMYISLIGIMLVLGINFYVKSKTEDAIFSIVEDIPKTNVAIIFGAGINNDKPSKYLKDRLDAGISLYKQRKVDKILLSGDNGNDAHDELTVMKLYCYEHGIDSNKIYMDYAGFDSYSTMYRAKHIFNVDTAILVTQKYHLNRCIYLGDKLGVKSYGLSANNGDYKGYKYYALREYLSVFKAVLDVMRDRKPRFLEEEVNINGPSNYTKE
ncbi:YdcF family protein [Sphingobacterium sp. SRCM116780]|uniref:SanA/YdcF family protein n=1 Tax=Sphingobacterium sp. SRCM116780 TaxID=2907623 RepID=UPI001F427F8A|nr:ElyC/SanA/YdcF family protein [Sphingobacterium sp. SRCM116780]UIR56812.1 YdcF family protein [Sphingobacterium sp. SRCM116780]